MSHAFSHGFHPQNSERLAAYWAEALGGPSVYMDERAQTCFAHALDDVGFADEERLRAALAGVLRLGNRSCVSVSEIGW